MEKVSLRETTYTMATEYSKHLSEPWFSLIRDGLKTCEGRLLKGDFALMKVGDIVRFHHGIEAFRVQITSLQRYSSFLAYLQDEGLTSCLPGITTFEEGCMIYRSYYSEEDERTYGIVAIRFTKITC